MEDEKQLGIHMQLEDVTLCCIDTRHPHLAIDALSRSMKGITFGRNLLLTNGNAEAKDNVKIETLKIDRITSIEDYSRFVMKELWKYIDTGFVLLIQWDGFVIHESAWSDHFLDYDYIGAPWPPDLPHLPANHSGVGNGGFSLRSRKLLHAIQDHRITTLHPEDVSVCVLYRSFLESEYGINFAPAGVAGQFAFEGGDVSDTTFGFHGLFNFPHVIESTELARILTTLPDDLTISRDALLLAKELIYLSRFDAAAILLRKRLKYKKGDADGIATASRLIRRNDPCWCGSSRKFSRCCGKFD